MAVASVRPATLDDVPEIIRIQSTTWRTAFAELVPRAALEQLAGPAAHRAWTSAVTAEEGHHVLVASEGKWTVGFCAAAPAGDEDMAGVSDTAAPGRYGQIVTVLVEPRWGRRGHGRRLLAAAFQALARDGAERGLTWLAEQDLASRACFDRIGWDPDGMVRRLDAGDRELREIRLTGPLRVENRAPRVRS
jgi:GNAT superfamily N-acetyltransferase